VPPQQTPFLGYSFPQLFKEDIPPSTLASHLGQVAAGHIEALHGVGQGVALVDGHSVRHTISRVAHDTGGAARGVQGQHGLQRREGEGTGREREGGRGLRGSR
jgi:hypothetical protein